jgi:hypothetical protein
LTTAKLIELAVMDWSDEGLDKRVAAGHAPRKRAAKVKEELPRHDRPTLPQPTSSSRTGSTSPRRGDCRRPAGGAASAPGGLAMQPAVLGCGSDDSVAPTCRAG